MTSNQSQAIWELCRQGLPLEADEAARHWSRGLGYQLDQQLRVAKTIHALIAQCNWEAEQVSEAA
jgi:hypothetical protein